MLHSGLSSVLSGWSPIHHLGIHALGTQLRVSRHRISDIHAGVKMKRKKVNRVSRKLIVPFKLSEVLRPICKLFLLPGDPTKGTRV